MTINLITLTPLAVAVTVPYSTAVLAGHSLHGETCVIFSDADITALSPAARQLLAKAYTKPSTDGLFTVVFPVRGEYGVCDPVATDAATVAAVSAALEDLACRRKAAEAAAAAAEAAYAEAAAEAEEAAAEAAEAKAAAEEAAAKAAEAKKVARRAELAIP